MEKMKRSLEADLRSIIRFPPPWIPEEVLLPFARACLGVKPDHEQRWYQDARWGYFAQRLLAGAFIDGRTSEAESLLEPVDWSPVHKLLEKNSGVILVSYHVGPWAMLCHQADACGLPIVSINGVPGKLRPKNGISVRDELGAKTALAKALLHLRRNGIILASPEGRWGSQQREVNFLGQPIKLFSGIGELAQLSGAPTCFFTATWTQINRIKIVLGPQITPYGSGEGWLRQWYALYLSQMAAQMRARPADLGFRHGIWDTPKDGLQWLNYGQSASPEGNANRGVSSEFAYLFEE